MMDSRRVFVQFMPVLVAALALLPLAKVDADQIAREELLKWLKSKAAGMKSVKY